MSEPTVTYEVRWSTARPFGADRVSKREYDSPEGARMMARSKPGATIRKITVEEIPVEEPALTATAGPEFPEGTPEYAEYAAKLRAELAKFAAGEHPYEYGQI